MTREQINEAKNFPYREIQKKTSEIKNILRGIEATGIEKESHKASDVLKKEVGSKVVGPIASLRKKLKETVEDKKATDDLKSNLASKKALERMEKEAKAIEKVAKTLNNKVVSDLRKQEVKTVNTGIAQQKARSKYQDKKNKTEKEGKFMKNAYAPESFKDRTKKYLGMTSVNEMAMKHLAPDVEKKYSKEELMKFFKEKSVDQLAKAYVKNARAEKMEDKKIKQGLGATFRNVEDKDKADKIKQAVKDILAKEAKEQENKTKE